MAVSIYKQGQGYWTRLLTAVGILMLAAAGAGWLWSELSVIRGDQRIYWQAGMAVLLLLVCGLVTYIITCRHKNVVDFMIATEGEMRKVNWPNRKEVYGSTVVVIGGTLIFAALLFIVDIIFGWFFQYIGILKT